MTEVMTNTSSQVDVWLLTWYILKLKIFRKTYLFLPFPPDTNSCLPCHPCLSLSVCLKIIQPCGFFCQSKDFHTFNSEGSHWGSLRSPWFLPCPNSGSNCDLIHEEWFDPTTSGSIPGCLKTIAPPYLHSKIKIISSHNYKECKKRGIQ